MGCCRRAFGGSSQVSAYDVSSLQEACPCGEYFVSQEARFCCFCGQARLQDGSDVERGSPKTDASSGQGFSPICPPSPTPVPGQRSRRRSGTGDSSSTVSSRARSNAEAEAFNDNASNCSTEDSFNAGKFGSPLGHQVSTPTTRAKSSSDLPRRSVSGTPARRPSVDAGLVDAGVASAGLGGPEDMLSALSQALKLSGSIVTQNLRMRVLQVPESLATAWSCVPKADMQMPFFDAKVDLDNLLAKLPSSALRPSQLSLQRVSFMSTDWLGMRLANGDLAQSRQFCLCAVALQNIGKNNSRSVVVESAESQDEGLVFACTPMYNHQVKPQYVETAEEISYLAGIVLNEAGFPAKKVTENLKSWCQKQHRRMDARDSKDDAPKEGKTGFFLLRGVAAALEDLAGKRQIETKASRAKSSAGAGRRGSAPCAASSENRSGGRHSTSKSTDSRSGRRHSTGGKSTDSRSSRRHSTSGTARADSFEEKRTESPRRTYGSEDKKSSRKNSVDSTTSASSERVDSGSDLPDFKIPMMRRKSDPGLTFSSNMEFVEKKDRGRKPSKSPSAKRLKGLPVEIMPKLDEDDVMSCVEDSEAGSVDGDGYVMKRRHSIGCVLDAAKRSSTARESPRRRRVSLGSSDSVTSGSSALTSSSALTESSQTSPAESVDKDAGTS